MSEQSIVIQGYAVVVQDEAGCVVMVEGLGRILVAEVAGYAADPANAPDW